MYILKIRKLLAVLITVTFILHSAPARSRGCGFLAAPGANTVSIQDEIFPQTLESLRKNILQMHIQELPPVHIVNKILQFPDMNYKQAEEIANNINQNIAVYGKFALAYYQAVNDIIYWLCGKEDTQILQGYYDIELSIMRYLESVGLVKIFPGIHLGPMSNNYLFIFEECDEILSKIIGFSGDYRSGYCKVPFPEGNIDWFITNMFTWARDSEYYLLKEDTQVRDVVEYYFKTDEEKWNEFRALLGEIKKGADAEVVDTAISEIRRRLKLLKSLPANSNNLMIKDIEDRLEAREIVQPGGAFKKAQIWLEVKRLGVRELIHFEKHGTKTILDLFEVRKELSRKGGMEFSIMPDNIVNKLDNYEKNEVRRAFRNMVSLFDKRFKERRALARQGNIGGLFPLVSSEAFVYLKTSLPKLKAQAEAVLSNENIDLRTYMVIRKKITDPETARFLRDKNRKEKEKSDFNDFQKKILEELKDLEKEKLAEHPGILMIKEAADKPEETVTIEILAYKRGKRKYRRRGYYTVECGGVRGKVDSFDFTKESNENIIGMEFQARIIKLTWDGVIPIVEFSVAKARQDIWNELKTAHDNEEEVQVKATGSLGFFEDGTVSGVEIKYKNSVKGFLHRKVAEGKLRDLLFKNDVDGAREFLEENEGLSVLVTRMDRYKNKIHVAMTRGMRGKRKTVRLTEEAKDMLYDELEDIQAGNREVAVTVTGYGTYENGDFSGYDVLCDVLPGFLHIKKTSGDMRRYLLKKDLDSIHKLIAKKTEIFVSVSEIRRHEGQIYFAMASAPIPSAQQPKGPYASRGSGGASYGRTPGGYSSRGPVPSAGQETTAPGKKAGELKALRRKLKKDVKSDSALERAQKRRAGNLAKARKLMQNKNVENPQTSN